MLGKLKKIQQQKQEQGFTIIEVMIVLAIAGLIILIVLLAVPALQRNGRNTAIKNDASAVAGGISEYESNNDGSVPTSITGTGTVDITGSGTPTTAKVQGNTQVSTTPSTGSAPAAGAPTPGNIVAYLGHKCGGGTSTRAVAIYYSIENNTSTAQQKCLDT